MSGILFCIFVYQMPKKKKIKNELKEPAAEYGREIHIFNSFKEREEFELNEALKQSPAERIKNTVELILRAYGFTRKSLRKRKQDNTIYIDQAG
jgi:hypothetical protein